MPISFLLSNWKIIAIAIAFLGAFYTGWHAHTVYDGYQKQKEEMKIINTLGEGQTKIINFNQDYDKELLLVKDDCISKPMPDSLRMLLTKHTDMP